MMSRPLICVMLPALILSCGLLSDVSGQEPASGDFDRRDFSGIYLLDNSVSEFASFGPDTRPQLTPRAMEIVRNRIPVPGTAARSHPLSPDVPYPHLSNDPEYECNPMGFPKILKNGEQVEFLMFPDRLLQIFQWEHRVRYIWLDGRELPSGESLDNLGPAWYGHSVGRWEGDTLVVDTVGVDERAWLDRPGHPRSLSGRIEERYRRVDADAIEMELTLYDPLNYTSPWPGAPKTFHRESPDDYTFYGWPGLFSGVTESICAPMDEVDTYNAGFRDPGALGPDQ